MGDSRPFILPEGTDKEPAATLNPANVIDHLPAETISLQTTELARQSYLEGGTQTRAFAASVNGAAIAFYHRFCDSNSQPTACLRLHGCRIRAIEAVEEAVSFFRLESGSGIGHDENGLAIAMRKANMDASS